MDIKKIFKYLIIVIIFASPLWLIAFELNAIKLNLIKKQEKVIITDDEFGIMNLTTNEVQGCEIYREGITCISLEPTKK